MDIIYRHKNAFKFFLMVFLMIPVFFFNSQKAGAYATCGCPMSCVDNGVAPVSGLPGGDYNIVGITDQYTSPFGTYSWICHTQTGSVPGSYPCFTDAGGPSPHESWMGSCGGGGGSSGGSIGVCSGTRNQCTTGNPINIGETALQYTWQCGITGVPNSERNCFESKGLVTPVCGATHNSCTTGALLSGTDKEKASFYEWQCYGGASGYLCNGGGFGCPILCYEYKNNGTISVQANIASSTWTITGGDFGITGASGTGNTASPSPFSHQSAGMYTISWGDVPGYDKPVSQTLTLTTGGSILFSGVYTALPSMGDVRVVSNFTTPFTLTGPRNLSDNTPWAGAGGGGYNSRDTTYYGVPAGTYTMTWWGPVPGGYVTPAQQVKVLNPGGAITFEGVYKPNGNGVCNATPYFCNSGTMWNNREVSGRLSDHLTWECQGSLSTAYCSADLLPREGACSATHYLCDAGTPQYPYEWPTRYTWYCEGRDPLSMFSPVCTEWKNSGTINISSNIDAWWDVRAFGPNIFNFFYSSGTGTSQVLLTQPLGTYQVEWGAVPGYTTPPSQIQNILANGTTISFVGNYVSLAPVPSVDTLTATPNPVAYNPNGTPDTASTLTWSASGGVTACYITGGIYTSAVVGEWYGTYVGGPSGFVSTGNLTADTTYTMNCHNGTTWAANPKTVTVTVPPPPTNPTHTCAPSGTSATLSWTPAVGYNAFYLRAKPSPVVQADPYTAYDDNYVTPSYTLNSITPGQSYTWWVHSKAPNGAWSNSIGGTFSCPVAGTLKICQDMCGTTGSFDRNGVSFDMAKNTTVNLRACYDSALICANSTPAADVTNTATWIGTNQTPISPPYTASDVVSVSASGVVTSGANTGGENITVTHAGVTQTTNANVTCTPVNCSFYANVTRTYCPKDPKQQFDDSCGGQTQPCTGTKSCRYDWIEGAP